MKSIIPSLGSEVKHKLDFSLIPIGIVALEFSIFSTELSKSQYPNLSSLIAMRVMHTITMILVAFVVSRIYIKLKLTELTYMAIALSGTSVIAIGILVYRYLAQLLEIETLNIYQNVATGLLQGFFWFPVFIIIGSKRTEIISRFREYEQRLIFSTRLASRTSEEFRSVQNDTQAKIRSELNSQCSALALKLSSVDTVNLPLPEANSLIQKSLHGDGLRRLSMRLETFGSEQEEPKFLGQNLKSVNLLINQFRILYATTVRIAPLKARTYALILIVLITPAYINYFTLPEAIFTYPLVSAAIFVASKLIVKAKASKSPNNLRNASMLIYLTGMLPFIFNRIGQTITSDPRTEYPIYIGALSLPLGYYLFMNFLQVLQPQAIHLISSDQLVASTALKKAVTNTVSEEFAHALSHRWAVYIHGKILTRLAATALKLETASLAGDRETFKQTVRSLLEFLKNPDIDFDQLPTDLESEVKSRLDPWLGLLEIDLHIDENLKEIRNERVRELGEVIEEIVSNSMRHGKAQKIDMRVIDMGDNKIKVISVDDALTPPPLFQSRYGLGTRIFNLASDGRWAMTRVESGTEFRLTMVIER